MLMGVFDSPVRLPASLLTAVTALSRRAVPRRLVYMILINSRRESPIELSRIRKIIISDPSWVSFLRDGTRHHVPALRVNDGIRRV